MCVGEVCDIVTSVYHTFLFICRYRVLDCGVAVKELADGLTLANECGESILGIDSKTMVVILDA